MSGSAAASSASAASSSSFSVPRVVVHPTKQLLSDAIGARLLTALVDVQAERGHVSVVLTGGSLGSAVLASLGALAGRDAVDWTKVDVWWGDERFLPQGDPDRNETQNRQALLDSLPLDPTRVRAMPGPDGPDGDDVAAAAARYAGWLAEAAGAGAGGARTEAESPTF
ncbi:MAG TPA: 6-phosphogluconolactonase, partial [Pedococcus sp.]|nr:6-phosphogluconolactonase [Pedococcus sp.]